MHTWVFVSDKDAKKISIDYSFSEEIELWKIVAIFTRSHGKPTGTFNFFLEGVQSKKKSTECFAIFPFFPVCVQFSKIIVKVEWFH